MIPRLNTAELLSEAATVREREIEQARNEERTIASESIERAFKEQSVETARTRSLKAKRIAAICSRVFLIAALGLAVIAIVRDYRLVGQFEGEDHVALRVVLSAVGIYAAADLFGILPAASARAALERMIERVIIRLQRAIA